MIEMKIDKFNKAISLLAVSLCATSVNATTNYLSEGHLSLEVISFTDNNGTTFDFDDRPASIVISAFDNFDDEDYSITMIGDAYADGVTTAISDLGLIELDAQASGYSGSSYAYADSDATALANFSFENTSAEDYSVNLELSYSFSGEVETDTPADQQNGLATLEIDLYSDSSFYQDIAIAMMTSLESGPFSGSSSMGFSLLLEANETENIYASINSYGESESVSAVPLPASILLMSSALAGLVVRRKTI